MYLLVGDETNMQPSKGVTFFVYGGIFFPVEVLCEMDAGVSAIRQATGFTSEDELKFATPTRPARVSPSQHTEAKRRVVDLCVDLGVKFIVHVIHHGIIKNQDIDQQVQWAADYVFSRFNLFLCGAEEHGLCIVDNLPVSKQFKYLSEKFAIGLRFPNGQTRRLDRIKLFGASCVNASHANSAMDIVLGSFRYCINDPSNIAAARKMMARVMSLMWHKKLAGGPEVLDNGLVIRPSLSRVVQDYPSFVADYQSLLDNVFGLLSDGE
jgi:hypothetical protein